MIKLFLLWKQSNFKNSIATIPAMTKTEQQYWQEIATDFWKEIEKEAEELEVTVDYYIEEFFTS